MKKRTLIILLMCILLVAVVVIGFTAFDDKKPYKDLDATQITSATVRLSPPDKTIEIEDVQELVEYLNDVIIYQEDNSYTEYYGQGVTFTLTMTDGTQTSIMAYNPFLVIDGIGYKTKYEPCEALNRYANMLLMNAEQITTTEIQPIITTQSTNTESTECTTSETTQESSEYIERQIVEAIYIDLYGSMVEPYPVLGKNSELIEYENDADYLIQNAKSLSERCLGNISDEEDAIEKARSVWKEKLGSEYIERIESEYVDVDGVKMRYERRNPPYAVKYYEEYDVWYIVPTAPCGTREDGVSFSVIWDFPPYLLIRGEDGMILGVVF